MNDSLPAPESLEALHFEWLEAESDTPDADEQLPGNLLEPSTTDVPALLRELERLRAVALCAARRLEDSSPTACPTHYAVITQAALLLRGAVAG